MRHRNVSRHEQTTQHTNAVVQAVEAAQAAISQHNAAPADEREALAHLVREHLDVLWMLLAEPLLHVAAGWRASGPFEDAIRTRTYADALEALAMNMFLNIVEALPSLHLDPERNVVGLLMTIARRGISKEHQQVYRTRSRGAAEVKEENLTPGTSAAGMFPPYELVSNLLGVLDSETHEQVEPVDMASLELEEQTVRALHLHQCWAVLRENWLPTLSRENQVILQARWFADPPLPFEEIVVLLGAGWTAPAVRKRMSRMLEAAADVLRERGLHE